MGFVYSVRYGLFRRLAYTDGKTSDCGQGNMNFGAKRLLLAQMLFFSPLFALPSQAAPASVDPRVVGVWELPIDGGRWVWTINPNGTYEFHSEAADGTAAHSGSISASAGHWSIHATNGYTDSGTYTSNATGAFFANGRFGTAAWNHPSSDVVGDILAGIAAEGVPVNPAKPAPSRSYDDRTGSFCNPCGGPQ
jgi:hypothetical protein